MDGNIVKRISEVVSVKSNNGVIEMVIPFVVDVNHLFANDYNPNRMPDLEMSLLKDCISNYGFLFPIVTTWDDEKNMYRIVDGYHRYEDLRQMGAEQVLIVCREWKYYQCMQLTVLMNRIKGMHKVESMSELVVKLEDQGMEDSEIAHNLGMEAEEYLRLKQQLGIAHAFRNHNYSNSWEIK